MRDDVVTTDRDVFGIETAKNSFPPTDAEDVFEIPVDYDGPVPDAVYVNTNPLWAWLNKTTENSHAVPYERFFTDGIVPRACVTESGEEVVIDVLYTEFVAAEHLNAELGGPYAFSPAAFLCNPVSEWEYAEEYDHEVMREWLVDSVVIKGEPVAVWGENTGPVKVDVPEPSDPLPGPAKDFLFELSTAASREKRKRERENTGDEGSCDSDREGELENVGVVPGERDRELRRENEKAIRRRRARMRGRW